MLRAFAVIVLFGTLLAVHRKAGNLIRVVIQYIYIPQLFEVTKFNKHTVVDCIAIVVKATFAL